MEQMTVTAKIQIVVTDTAYYCQPKRKLAIIKGEYKLIYCKEKKYG